MDRVATLALLLALLAILLWCIGILVSEIKGTAGNIIRSILMHRDYIIFFMSFLCGLVDNATGMGYATILVPFLILSGFAPIEVILAVLVVQIVTNFSGGFVKYLSDSKRQISEILRAVLPLALCTTLPVFLGAFLCVNLGEQVIKCYIGILVVCAGIWVVCVSKKTNKLTWKWSVILDMLGGFNKGISGVGFGPIVSGSKILFDVSEGRIIATTYFTRGWVCCAGAVVLLPLGVMFNLKIFLPLITGALASVFVSFMFIKKTNLLGLKFYIGCVAFLLGATVLINAIF